MNTAQYKYGCHAAKTIVAYNFVKDSFSYRFLNLLMLVTVWLFFFPQIISEAEFIEH